MQFVNTKFHTVPEFLHSQISPQSGPLDWTSPRLLSTRIRIKTEMFQGNRVHITTLHTLEFLNLDFQPNPL